MVMNKEGILADYFKTHILKITAGKEAGLKSLRVCCFLGNLKYSR